MEDSKTKIQEELGLKDIILVVKEWWQYLFSKAKLIVLVAFLSAVLGVLYSLTKKDMYIATLTFALEDDKGGLSGGMGIASQLGIDIGGGGGGVFTGSNLIELFKSRSMVEKTLLSPVTIKGKTISLAEMYIRENKWRDAWNKNKALKAIQFRPYTDRKNFTRAQDSILERIYENISKSGGLTVMLKDKKSSILTVEVKSPNEIFSKTFNITLASVVSDFYIDTKSKKARINMTILQRQLDSIRGELNGSITGVAVANDRTFALNPALNVKRVPSVRRQVDVQANTAILTELIRQTELSKVTLRKDTPLIQIIDKPIYPLKKERFGKLRGIIYGGFIGGFLTVMFFIFKKMWRNLMK